MSEYEPEVTEFEIRSNLESTKKEIANVEVKGQGLNAEIEEISKEEQELEKQMAELRKQLQAKKSARTQVEAQRNELKKYWKEQDELRKMQERKLQTFLSEAEIRKRQEEERDKFAAITASAPWRVGVEVNGSIRKALPHQLDGGSRLAGAKRAILGDKRGLGKTLTALIACDMMQAKKILIVMPQDVIKNFMREITMWTPHRIPVNLSRLNKRERDFTYSVLLKNSKECIALINYEAWSRDKDVIEHLVSCQFDTVIIDEAHNLKNKETSAYKGARQIVYGENKCHVCGENDFVYKEKTNGEYGIGKQKVCNLCYAHSEKFRDNCSVVNVIPMTGTPILNKPQDLWTLLNLIDGQTFAKEIDFLYDYCVYDAYVQRWKFKHGGSERLLKSLGARFIARTDKTAGVQFPKQDVIVHEIEFDHKMYPHQFEVMQQIQKHGAIKMGDATLNVIGVLAELMRRRQALVWPGGIQLKDEEGRVVYSSDCKESIVLDKVMELVLTAIEEGDRIVVFSQFKEALKELEVRIKAHDITVCRYDGDISDAKANEFQLDFDIKTADPENYKYQVGLCHYKKGGVGLNLTAARQMIIPDREWNPGKEDQAQGRVQRLDGGQSIVHRITVPKTVATYMDNLMDEKAAMIGGFESTNNETEQFRQILLNEDLL